VFCHGVSESGRLPPTMTHWPGFVVPAGGQSLYLLAVNRSPVRFTTLAPDGAEHAASSIVNRTS
jgi:hypothetical protein